MDQENRVVILIDMDCFYCQVEEKLNPKLKGRPIAVVQYNPWKGGGIIAVNYVARAMGVTRHMRGDEAKEKCPEIELPSVPCLRGKADITKYREAGKEVARVLQKFTPLLERASIDEAYMDITATVDERLKSLNVNTITTAMMPNTYALGYECVDEFLNDVHACGVDNIDFDYEHAKRLLVGAVIVTEIRAAVFEETGYRCSAGISHNKILAKLVCGMNKPNKQTVLPKHCINILYKTLPIKKVKHLGGKFGDMVCEILKVSKMCELQMFPEKELQAQFDEKNGTWLYNIARGIDFEPVQARFNPKSIGCCKQFRGKSALVDLESLKKWLKDLGDEIDDRLEKDALENNRTPKQMVVSYSTQLPDGRDTSSSRSYNFVADDELCGELFSNKALDLLIESCEGVKVKDGESNRALKAPIKFLGISVGKFEDISEIKKTKKILDYFGASSSKVATDKTKENITNTEQENNKPQTEDKNKTDVKNNGKDYIMKKFLQTGDNDTQQIPNNCLDKNAILESSLDKQESFFTKMLNGNLKDFRKYMESEKQTIRPTTPVCDVVKCGDDSIDTDYSGSTINMEINKSIALFEEDPQEIARVSSIRNLLNKSQVMNDEETETISESEENTNVGTDLVQVIDSSHNIETFQCSECRKTIIINMAAEHADYHFALSLRDEQRQQVRKEIKENNINRVKRKEESKKIEEACDMNETVSSIATFLIKIDSNIPTEVCSECGKRIPIEKLREHLDFHEARKLSRQLNKKTIPLLTNSTITRKRKSTSHMKKNKMPCRPIDSFFR